MALCAHWSKQTAWRCWIGQCVRLLTAPQETLGKALGGQSVRGPQHSRAWCRKSNADAGESGWDAGFAGTLKEAQRELRVFKLAGEPHQEETVSQMSRKGLWQGWGRWQPGEFLGREWTWLVLASTGQGGPG